MNTQTKIDNRINQLFRDKSEEILSVYFTAGYPQLNDTREIIELLSANGVDLIEIGIPFSDPVADGPTIQASSEQALQNGISLELLFDQLKDIRQNVDIPLILMGYLNPIMQYGIERFCKEAEDIGIDGLIIPDLPMQEYLDEYKTIFDRHLLHNIFLISPQTSLERIRLIDSNSGGFIYMVSSASITGAKSEVSADQEVYFNRIKKLGLDNECLIGFGISNKSTFQKACKYAKGAIIGSAFIKAIGTGESLQSSVPKFIKNIKGES